VFRPCDDCDERAVTRCGRCQASLCRRHAPAAGRRCRACERDYQDEAPMRMRIKAALGLPPAALATVAMMALLLPVSGAGWLGTVMVAGSAAVAGTSTAAGLFRAIDRAARAQFLREHGRALPTARLLPRHR